MMINNATDRRKIMINYLLSEARYTKNELKKLDDDTLFTLYKGEREVNATNI